jgi:integrase/recombinase XerD
MTYRTENVESLFALFLQEKRFITNCTERTLECYQEIFDRWQKFAGGVPTQESLTRFVVGMRRHGHAVTTVNISIRSFNVFLSWLHENGHLAERLRMKQLKGEKKVMRVLDDNQLKALLAWKPNKSLHQQRIYAVLCTLVDTGARITECLTLKVEDVDFNNLLLRLYGKGRKERLVPMSIELRKVLYAYMQKHRPHAFGSPYLFCSKTGTVMTYRNAYRDLEEVLKKVGISKAGMDGFFHAFRRKYARSFLRHGGNLLYLQTAMGHSTVGVTKQYVEVETDDLKAAHFKTSLLSRLK